MLTDFAAVASTVLHVLPVALYHDFSFSCAPALIATARLSVVAMMMLRFMEDLAAAVYVMAVRGQRGPQTQ
jgi:hypothetical protein